MFRVTRQCPRMTIVEEKGEPKQGLQPAPRSDYQPSALPPGQAGLRETLHSESHFYAAKEQHGSRQRQRNGYKEERKCLLCSLELLNLATN